MEPHDRKLCASCLQNEYDRFREECADETLHKSDEWFERFKIDSWRQWDYSMEEATLTFSEPGVAKVICEIQVAGTVQGDSWQWSWANKKLPERCKAQIRLVKEFGAVKQWEQLTTPFLANEEYLGWECTSIASHLLNGIGTYRAPYGAGENFVYLVVLSAQFTIEQAIQ